MYTNCANRRLRSSLQLVLLIAFLATALACGSGNAEAGCGSTQACTAPDALTNLTASPSSGSVVAGQALTLTPIATTAGPSVRVTYTYVSSTPSVATVSADGVVQALAPGATTVTLTATGVGTGFTTKALTTTVSVTVTAQPNALNGVTLSVASATVTVGQTVQATPTADRASTAVTMSYTYSSNTPSVATVSAAGLVSAVGPGSSIISVAAVGSAPGFTTNERIASVTVVVTAPPSALNGVTLTASGTSVNVGQTVQLTATAEKASSAVTVTLVYATSAPSVAIVSAAGLVTGVATGTTTITVTATGTGVGYTTSARTAAIAIAVIKLPVGRVITTPLQLSLFQGQTAQIRAVVEDVAGTVVTDRPVEWLSADPTRVSVSQTGFVTAIAPGVVTVMAVSEGRFASTNVLVQQNPIDSIVVDPQFTLVRGTSSAFTIFVRDAQGNELRNRTIVTTSDKPSIALVNSSTNNTTVSVGGVLIGEATITLQGVNANGQNEGKASRVKVIVRPP